VSYKPHTPDSLAFGPKILALIFRMVGPATGLVGEMVRRRRLKNIFRGPAPSSRLSKILLKNGHCPARHNQAVIQNSVSNQCLSVTDQCQLFGDQYLLLTD